jgi:hypothetical protein
VRTSSGTQVNLIQYQTFYVYAHTANERLDCILVPKWEPNLLPELDYREPAAYFGFSGVAGIGAAGIGRRLRLLARGVTSFSARAESLCITSTESDR